MTKRKYEEAPKQSEYPKQACNRAAWLLNSLGTDVTYKRLTMKQFNAAYGAIKRLNIPVECTEKQTAGKKTLSCFCYRPISGIARAPQRKRGKRGGKS